MNRLPTEITNMIFLYLQNPEAKLIAKEIEYYENDHNTRGSLRTGFYKVKSYMTFSEYCFDVRKVPNIYDYTSVYERRNLRGILLIYRPYYKVSEIK